MFTALFLVSVALTSPAQSAWGPPLPWREAGLTPRAAAAHLLDRFAFGAGPGEVDRLLEQGLEAWLDEQLAGDLHASPVRDHRWPAMEMAQEEIIATHRTRYELIAAAVADGAIEETVLAGKRGAAAQRREVEQLDAFAARAGLRRPADLVDEARAHKVVMAVQSRRQLLEVMTDFWFNHFNVSAGKHQATRHILSYERDAIRPRVFGVFGNLLRATAAHPAMLLYLDNAESVAPQGVRTTLEVELGRARDGLTTWPGERNTGDDRGPDDGLNENYARELLELHTIGVDGGYGQHDVVEVARAFTGWSTFPSGPAHHRLEARLRQAEAAGGLGFVVEGQLVFRADHHDAQAKNPLGLELSEGRGIEDGDEVLRALAAHPATARRVARRLAQRFVNDEPSKALIDSLAVTYRRTGGDVRRVLRVIAERPEFWAEARVRTKVKSPFELAISSLRVCGAEIVDPNGVIVWIERMGQPLYGCAPPTGWPETGTGWTGASAMIERFSFATALAHDEVEGVRIDVATLVGELDPMTGEAVGTQLLTALLPGVDPAPLLDSLKLDESEIADDAIPGILAALLASPEFQRR